MPATSLGRQSRLMETAQANRKTHEGQGSPDLPRSRAPRKSINEKNCRWEEKSARIQPRSHLQLQQNKRTSWRGQPTDTYEITWNGMRTQARNANRGFKNIRGKTIATVWHGGRRNGHDCQWYPSQEMGTEGRKYNRNGGREVARISRRRNHAIGNPAGCKTRMGL